MLLLFGVDSLLLLFDVGCFGLFVLHEFLQYQVTRAVHYDFTIVHHNDAVDDLQHLRTVGYQKHGAVATPLGDGIECHTFGSLVQAGGRLVQQDDFRIAQGHACQGDDLFLTAGQAQAVFTQRHIQTARMVADDFVEAEAVERNQQVLVGRVAAGTR